MKNPKKDLEDFNRFRKVLTIITEEGFKYLLDRINLSEHVPLTKRVVNRKRETRPERVRETVEKLGTTYIKFGQILAERPDIVSEKYCEELEKLEDSAPEFPIEKARNVVDEEIGLDEIEEFEEEAIAAASIAQVHRGKLKNGDEVIFKIRRPGVVEQVEKDLDILLYIASKVDGHVGIGKNFIYKEAEEFARWTRNELDFEKEARNARVFRENMEDEENVRVPKIYPELSSERLLVMEYIDAFKCDNVEKIREAGVDEKEIARSGIRAVLKQILRDGLLHADPHPSNFMVDKDGNLVFLDFGMMTRISEETQRELGMMMLQIGNQDVEGLLETIRRIAEVKEDADIESFKKELERETLKLRDTSIEEQSVSRVLIRLSQQAATHRIYLPTKITLIGKGILTIEGIGLKIYPEFEVGDEFQDQVEKLLLKQNSPDDMAKDFLFNMIQNRELITKMPEKLNKKIDEVERKQKIEIRQKKRQKFLPIILIISSTILVAASLYDRMFLYIGLLELLYGLHLFEKN
ncbi:MAG: ABC1 kinase family protein [Candidatus Nanohaloarchaea archaeon]